MAVVRVIVYATESYRAEFGNLRPVLFFHGAAIQVSSYGPIAAVNFTISHSLSKLLSPRLREAAFHLANLEIQLSELGVCAT